MSSKAKIEYSARRLLEGLETYLRDGTNDTPARVARAWAEHWGAGYRQDPADYLKCFEERSYDEMVVVKDIPLYSHCEHHIAPIFGTATVAYVPTTRVLGLSKLSRVVDVFARRLQTQERLTVQVADALYGPSTEGRFWDPFSDHGTSLLQPRGVAVMLRCRHMCMESRGICKQGQETVTTALRGVMRDGQPRAEFLRVATG